MGTPSPSPWDLTLQCQSQYFRFPGGVRFFHRTPVWSWPRSRCSGCVPAEPYPSLRSLVVYSLNEVLCNGGKKNP
jgi:hypothetical protein